MGHPKPHRMSLARYIPIVAHLERMGVGHHERLPTVRGTQTRSSTRRPAPVVGPGDRARRRLPAHVGCAQQPTVRQLHLQVGAVHTHRHHGRVGWTLESTPFGTARLSKQAPGTARASLAQTQPVVAQSNLPPDVEALGCGSQWHRVRQAVGGYGTRHRLGVDHSCQHAHEHPHSGLRTR